MIRHISTKSTLHFCQKLHMLRPHLIVSTLAHFNHNIIHIYISNHNKFKILIISLRLVSLIYFVHRNTRCQCTGLAVSISISNVNFHFHALCRREKRSNEHVYLFIQQFKIFCLKNIAFKI